MMVSSQLKRLVGVFGHAQRKNDLLYHPPLAHPSGSDPTEKKVVVYFGGDVQDYEDNMTAHRDNLVHVKWSLESTCHLLAAKFRNFHIFIVHPANMYLGTFSCYRNFVKCDDIGVPQFSPDNQAFHHLLSLIRNGFEMLKPSDESDAGHGDKNGSTACTSVSRTDINDLADSAGTTGLEDVSEIKIVGFSKGCVVLNQLVNEIPNATNDSNLLTFLQKIKTWYWLDGGHAGGKNTWITDENLLLELVSRDSEIQVHVTPYQIEDHSRPWIKQEEKRFSNFLLKNGKAFHRELHFADLQRSIENHFCILNVFA